MDSAVPQAPAPMTAMSLTSSSHSSTPQGKAVLGAGEQAGDILMMLGDNQQGSSHSRPQDALHGRTGLYIKQVDKGGQRSRGHDRAQRDITEEGDQSSEDTDRDQHCLGDNSYESSDSGSHSLATAKFHP